MPLTAGSRLAHYEIGAPLGAGGMGEVYRARDTRLNRQVAIKTLPDAFALDPNRLARFQREAQLLAALSHPNIAAIYGIEESAAGVALILELVEGETLAERLLRAGSGLPLDEAIHIARQICDALEAADDNAIVHRDLKPANIKITPAGVAKVLDFGLAKLVTPPASSTAVDATSSPTMVTGRSMPGMLLGTAAYMSPEQAKGLDADRRADIWAFGCVLYEMLAGAPPFAGGSIGEVIGEVLKSEPDWTRLPAGTPASVRRVLRRCLTKDPRRRLQHIGDARLDLDDAPDAPADTVPADSRALWRWKAAAATLATIAVIVALGGYAMRGAPAPAAGVKRLHIQAPQGADDIHDFAVSPDGRHLALVAATDNGFAIFIRSLESLESRRVVDIEARQKVFWSPNGQSLGFFEGGHLKVLNVETGETRIVCEAPQGFGGSWGADDTIIFTPRATGGVHRVSATGGAVTEITSPDPKVEESHRWPRFLPDGRRFTFLGWTSRDTSKNTRFTVQMAGLDAAPPIVLAGASSAAVYDPGGYLVFALNAPQRLVALSFDAAAGTVTGDAVTIAEDLDYDWISGSLPVSAANDGTLFYLNNQHLRSTLTWMGRDGRELGTVGEPGIYYDPALSADDAALLVERSDPSVFAGDIWRVEFGPGTFSRLTHEPSFEGGAVWSPDGRRVVYSSDREGLSSLYIRDADGSNEPVKVYGAEGSLAYASGWSADGQQLLFLSINQERNYDLWVLSMADGKARPLLESRYGERDGSFSPDGKWIAYTSTESGQAQVYVRSWPAFTGVRQISSRGGVQPAWRGDSGELFYLTPEGSIMAAPISSNGERVDAGPPVMLFNPDLEIAGLRNRFVVTADGQRFLILKSIVNRRAAPISVLVNWASALRR